MSIIDRINQAGRKIYGDEYASYNEGVVLVETTLSCLIRDIFKEQGEDITFSCPIEEVDFDINQLLGICGLAHGMTEDDEPISLDTFEKLTELQSLYIIATDDGYSDTKGTLISPPYIGEDGNPYIAATLYHVEIDLDSDSLKQLFQNLYELYS